MSGKHAKKGKKVDVAKNKAGVEIAVGDIVLVHPSRKTELPYVSAATDCAWQCRCIWAYTPNCISTDSASTIECDMINPP